MTLAALPPLEPDLVSVDGTVSIWCGTPGSEPANARDPHASHYAASTMKLASMAAA
jgi:beta-lactamase class A